MHVHTHHNPSLDSFCRAHSIHRSDGEEEFEDQQLRIAKKLIRDIKENLVEIKRKRSGNTAFSYSASGSAIYSQALLKQLIGENLLSLDKNTHLHFIERQTTYIESLTESIRIKNQEVSSTKKSKDTILMQTNKIFALILIFLAPILFFGSRMIIENQISQTNQTSQADCLATFIIEEISPHGISGLMTIYLSLLILSFFFATLWNLNKYSEYPLSSTLKKTILKIIYPRKITSLYGDNFFEKFKCRIGSWWINCWLMNKISYWELNKESKTYSIIKNISFLVLLIVLSTFIMVFYKTILYGEGISWLKEILSNTLALIDYYLGLILPSKPD